MYPHILSIAILLCGWIPPRGYWGQRTQGRTNIGRTAVSWRLGGWVVPILTSCSFWSTSSVFSSVPSILSLSPTSFLRGSGFCLTGLVLLISLCDVRPT